MLNVVISKTGIQSPSRQDSISDSEINRLVNISVSLVDWITNYYMVINTTGIHSPRRQDSVSDSAEINRVVNISSSSVDWITPYFRNIWYIECGY